MHFPKLSIGWLGIVAVFSLAPFATAGTVTMKLTGAGNITMGGVYVNPYTATVDGVEDVTVVCNDFNAATYINETWEARVSTFDDLSQTRWAGATGYLNLYNQVAWLTLQLLATPETQAAARGQLSFAIWGIFTPTALDKLGTTNRQAAQGWIDLAKQENLTAAQFSNFLVYTPVGQGTCNGKPCGVPQEFLTVRTPEASASWMLGLNLLAVGGLMLWFRRRIAGS